MTTLFEFLFKYRPIVFDKGHLVFGTSGPTRLVLLIAAVAAAFAIATYARVRVRGTPTDRWVLVGLRALALALLMVALWRPMMLVASSVSQRNVVGVLIDDSRSMLVRDMNGHTRADVVRSLLGGRDSALYKSLAKKFTVRFFRVGDGGTPLTRVGELAFTGDRTRIATALDGVREELAGAPVAGLVLASDGADNTPGALSSTLDALNARHIPVFTVGVGQERFAKDLEISRLDAPQRVLKGSAVVLGVHVSQRGFDGATVPLIVEDSGHIVTTRTVTLPKGIEATTVRVRISAEEAGARLFTVRLAAQPGEMVTENNAQTALITVQDRRDKILYIEGEPRYETAFLRRATQDDQNLQLATMVRYAKDDFFRAGIDSAAELAQGFPKTREELFAYRGLVLGSIEASYFTFDQLQMIADFVRQRGGGLLMLGGRKSFAEGGYAGTPVGDALPVELPAGRQERPAFREVKVGVTPLGALAPVTQLAGDEAESLNHWRAMPAVTSVNMVTRPKLGAITLLEGTGSGGARASAPSIVMAEQRYGRGKAIAFPVQDSWLWQMRADAPLGDVTYQSFWRQTFRWLTSDVPDRVQVTPAADRAWVNEPLAVTVSVADQLYANVDGADVNATIQAPSGAKVAQRVPSVVTRDGGEYRLTYTPTEQGVYRIQVAARLPGERAGAAVTSEPVLVEVGTPTTEYVGAELRASLLKRAAEVTGGRYYTPATVKDLAEDIAYTGAGDATMERLDLWDMPALLILLLALLGVEWGYRRARGLA